MIGSVEREVEDWNLLVEAELRYYLEEGARQGN